MVKRELKKKLFEEVLNPESCPQKVPLFLNLQGWIVYHNAGYEYTEAVYDGSKVLNAYEKAIKDFEADIYYDMGGFASMFCSRALGSEDYTLSDKNYAMNFKDIAYIQSADDYQAIADDPVNYLWNTFYPNKFKNLTRDKAKETISEYLRLSNEHYEKSEALKQKLAKEIGTLFFSDVPMYQTAFDYFFQYMVGIKGISMDMRRNGAKLKAALDSFEALFNGYMDTITPVLSKDEMPFQAQICILGQTITNPKQFEKYIWEHLAKKLDSYIEKDLKIYLMVEGAGGPLLDFLDYIPDGMCALHLEMDNLDDVKTRFGKKFTYVGGLPVSVLGKASLSECKKYTEDVLEKYGHDGNFIFTTDKGVVYPGDVTVENLKMVCETVNNFRI